jgi:hypothetical protein
LVFSAPGRLYDVLSAFSGYVHSEDYVTKFKAILITIQEASLLSETDRQYIITAININLAWFSRNFAAIEVWLNEQSQNTTPAPTDAPSTLPTAAPTDAPSTLPTTTPTDAPSTLPTAAQTDPTTSTTLGSSSVVASLAIVLLCAIVKHFI